jgi:hypothetical protein
VCALRELGLIASSETTSISCKSTSIAAKRRAHQRARTLEHACEEGSNRGEERKSPSSGATFVQNTKLATIRDEFCSGVWRAPFQPAAVLMPL